MAGASGGGPPSPKAGARRKEILALFAAGDAAALERAASAAAREDAQDPFFWKALGVARNLLGQRGDAVVEPFREAARLDPRDPEVYDGLGQALARAGRLDEALAAGARAAERAPRHAVIQTNYGNLLAEAQRTEEALARHRAALAIDPRLAPAWVNLGAALKGIPWRHGEARQAVEQALAIDPMLQAAWDNLLFLLQYADDATPLDILRASLAGGAALTRSIPPRPRPLPRDRSGGPLRVGWISADFREHPVGNALRAVVAHFPRLDVEIHAYSNSTVRDGVTERIAGSVRCWRDVAGLGDEALTELVVADGIDVLVDLSGRTRGHRLGVFARQAAPVQVCWLGWFSTSGLPQFDAYLGDHVVLPESDAPHFAEDCRRLAGPYYVQALREPGVALDVPADEAPIRFGCYNTLAKLSSRTLDLWSRILGAVPDATLALKSREFADPAICDGLRGEMARRGIAPSRLRLSGSAPLADYLAAFRDIDLSLDPTPYTGGATTFDSLWMGVPVLTLVGDRPIARQGETLLSRVGLDDWITRDEDAYVARAVDAARDPGALRAGRAVLRERFLASPLLDGASLAGQLAEAWHGLDADRRNGRLRAVLPDDPIALERSAGILLHLRRWDDAQAAWAKLARLAAEGPSPVPAAHARAQEGIALQGAGRPAEALPAYREALSGLVGDAAAAVHVNAGMCCTDLGQFEAALAHFDAALRLRPGDPVAIRHAALAREARRTGAGGAG